MSIVARGVWYPYSVSPFLVGAWLSLVERLVRDQEAGGSNPLAPTKSLIDLQTFPPYTRVQHRQGRALYGSDATSSMTNAACAKLVREGCHADGDFHSDKAAR